MAMGSSTLSKDVFFLLLRFKFRDDFFLFLNWQQGCSTSSTAELSFYFLHGSSLLSDGLFLRGKEGKFHVFYFISYPESSTHHKTLNRSEPTKHPRRLSYYQQ